MTMAQHLNSAVNDGRALRTRQHITHGMRLLGDHTGTLTIVVTGAGVVAWSINTYIVVFAPVLNVTFGMAVVLILAAFGAAHTIRGLAYGFADRIDPDSRDGDDLWDVAQQIDATTRDLLNGADLDDTSIALQASKVVPALRGLVGLLSVKYAENGKPDEAAALEETEALLSRAANSLGHRDDDE
ncbi:hypothetical protein [Streptomyces sp. NPDC001068]|uniref:hypothetical protein n=1 Tax=Streptomyces sp. NPDC001068 TaxID=3364544 RepID=UPI0036C5567F